MDAVPLQKLLHAQASAPVRKLIIILRERKGKLEFQRPDHGFTGLIKSHFAQRGYHLVDIGV